MAKKGLEKNLKIRRPAEIHKLKHEDVLNPELEFFIKKLKSKESSHLGGRELMATIASSSPSK
jgi:hypothetical protein